MIDFTPLAAVAALNVAAAISPGPAFVLITRTAAASSRSSAVKAAAGTVPTAVKWAALLVVLCNESIWYGSIALCFGSSLVQRRYRRVKASLERIFGTLLTAFRAKLVWNGAQA